ncbi:MAG: Txe/YoeB family addiction module toxin [Bryobacteraceae bacterium]
MDRIAACPRSGIPPYLNYWIKTDRTMALRTTDLIEAILREPFQSIGETELLHRELAGCWSRRINQEHPLVYRLSAGRIVFLQERYH